MLVIERKVYKIYTLRKTADINAILHIIAFIAINNIPFFSSESNMISRILLPVQAMVPII